MTNPIKGYQSAWKNQQKNEQLTIAINLSRDKELLIYIPLEGEPGVP